MAYFEDYGSDFHFYYGSTNNSGNLPGMHIHPQYEVMIVINEIEHSPYINGIDYPTTYLPSATIVSPFTMHKTKFDRQVKNERYVFYFGSTLIDEFPSFFKKFNSISKNLASRYTLSPELLEKILPMLKRARENPTDTIFMKLNFMTVFYMILNEAEPDLSIQIPTSTNKVGQIIEYMVTHCKENLTAEEVAKHFFMSRSKLNQDFKTHMKIGFHQLFMEIKLNQACFMLQNDDGSIKEIASQLGFEKENYFNTFFKRMTGTTPLQYKKRIPPLH